MRFNERGERFFAVIGGKNKKLMNPGFPAAHLEPAYRCFLPDLTGFTDRGCAGPGLMSAVSIADCRFRISDFQFRNPHSEIRN